MSDVLLSTVLDGMLTGSLYALMALGVTLIYSVLHFVDFAHGSLLTAAMLVAWVLAAKFDIDPYASLPLITLMMFATGWVVSHAITTGAAAHRARRGVLVTLGLGIGLGLLQLAVCGPVPRGIGVPYASAFVQAGPLVLRETQIVGAAVSAAIAGFLWLFMTQTDTGRSIRAVAREPEAARLVGIRPARMEALAYGIGTACMGAAGCLLLPGQPVSPALSPHILLATLAAVVLGGLGRFGGAVLGGVAVGIVEHLGNLVSDDLGWLAVAVLLLAAILLRRLPRCAPAQTGGTLA